MTGSPATCTPETSLHEVARMMVECDCGAIPVVAGNGQSGRPTGIVTDRDIVVRLVAQGQNPLEKTARDAMTESAITVRDDADLERCAKLMEENQVRRILVVNDEGNITGICAQADVARHGHDELTGELVEEISEESR